MQVTNQDMDAMADCISDMLGNVDVSLEYLFTKKSSANGDKSNKHEWHLCIINKDTAELTRKRFCSWAELRAWVHSQDKDFSEQVIIDDSPQAGSSTGTIYPD